jgi:hypothetical protein
MILGDGTEVRVGNTYGQGEVEDERGSKEMDRCPLTSSIGRALDALGQANVTLRHPPLSCGHLFMGGLVLGGLVL